MEVKYNLLEKD